MADSGLRSLAARPRRVDSAPPRPAAGLHASHDHPRAVLAPPDHLEQQAGAVADDLLHHGTSTRLPLPPLHQASPVDRSNLESPQPAPTRTAAAASDLDGLRGGGSPLPDGERRFFESRFGHSFADVRIHADSAAAALARRFDARALTRGQDIVFGTDQYSPATRAGRRLLAHELAHVVQQGSAAAELRTGAVPAGQREGPPIVQFDLARAEPKPDAVAPLLTPDQVKAAIKFNQQHFSDPYVFAVIRDVIGVARFPAVLDEDFVQAIGRWQVRNNLADDGRLTGATISTVVAELVAESKLVPALLQDAVQVELEAPRTFNRQRSFDRRTIMIIQALVAAPTSGEWDNATLQQVMAWQRSHHLTVDGEVGPDTLRTLILELVASSLFDDAIHVIVNAHHFPTANLGSISFDATVKGADAVTTGTIGAGQPQTVRVGPSTFTADYAHMIRIIGHELQHVQQRSGKVPITDQHVREFLAFAWEALATDSPPLAPADRVTHANIAISHWNLAAVADRTPHQAVRDKLDRLVAAGGVGNF